MSRTSLTRMTKLEVVVRGADAAQVSQLLKSSGVTGYTSLTGVSGFGHNGHREGGLLFNDTDTLDLLIAVMPDDRADAVIAGLEEMFEEHSGVMFVTDTYVSRPGYFAGGSDAGAGDEAR